MKKVRFRFAPSPTGYLHIGGLRTALFAYLGAKSQGGEFILRIEDTDSKREVAGAVDSLIEILKWSGIKFDEGEGVGGKFGPYIQSERKKIYNKHLSELLKKDGAYHCFCSPERLTKMREDQQSKKLPPRYDRLCRDLSPKEVKEKLKNKEQFVIRQKMPLEGEVVVKDLLRGEIKFQASELDDQVLIKTNGMPTYQFAVVVDDHTMEISHVVRGEEWIPSFPKNILLYRSFAWEEPIFAHLPLALNKEGGKLSKRQGDVSVEDFKKKGYLIEALINFCALLGWHPKGDQDIFTLDELVKIFRIEDIGISPAIFDIEKLDYLNGYYIRQKKLDELTDMCLPYLRENIKLGTDPRKKERDFIKSVVFLEQERLKKLSEIGELTDFFFKDEIEYEKGLLIWKKLTEERVKNNLQEMHQVLNCLTNIDWDAQRLNDVVFIYLKGKEAKVGDYLWPLRVALSGKKASPSPFEIAAVLGREETISRIEVALKKLS